MSAGDRITRPRPIGLVHWRGLWTFYVWSLRRLLKFGLETLVGPVLSSLLFLLVFSIALAETQVLRENTSFIQFLAPGIAMFTLINGAFDNAAFPVVYDKLEGSMQDLLMSPLAPWEVALGYVLGGATAGVLVGGATLAVASAFVALPLPGLGWVAAFGVLSALAAACVGVIVGLWAEKWDQLSMVDTFMLLPLAFLSGAFFTLDSVPAFGAQLIQANPVFYAVDGVRAGALGWSTAAPALSLAVVAALLAALGATALRLFQIGYKIKP